MDCFLLFFFGLLSFEGGKEDGRTEGRLANRLIRGIVLLATIRDYPVHCDY